MSTVFLNNVEHELLVEICPPANGSEMLRLSYRDAFGGGACNVHLQRERAEQMRDALTVFLKSNGKNAVTIGRRADGAVQLAFGYKVAQKLKPACQHLKGYWINYRARTFRCYGCQYQFALVDLKNRKDRRIEKWNL